MKARRTLWQMNKVCPRCNTAVSENDSNAENVCVNCQGYYYYHQEETIVNRERIPEAIEYVAILLADLEADEPTVDAPAELLDFILTTLQGHSAMELYQFDITTRDGEHEYTQSNYVAAPDLISADEYAQEFLSDYFGEETVPMGSGDDYKGHVETEDMTLAARIDWVCRASSISAVGTDGRGHAFKILPA